MNIEQMKKFPPLPFAVFDEFGQACEDRVNDHYHAARGAQWSALIAGQSGEAVAWVDERAISWLEAQRNKRSAHITTKLSGVKSFERPMALYAGSAPVRQEKVDALREALLTARDHIDMDALRISHCKDAAAIDAAIASLPAPQAVQAEPLRVALEELQKLDFDMRVTTSEGLPPEACRIIDTALAAAPSPDGKAEQEEAPSDLSVLRRIHKLLVNQVRPALRSPVITKDVDDAAEALSALMSRTQTEAPSDSTLKLAEMILADCGHSTAISTRLRDRVAERIERHLAAQPTEASCRSTNADGHVLLPFEPTDEMEVAAEDAYEESGSPFPNWKAVYRAMRDASLTTQPTAGPEQAEAPSESEAKELWDCLCRLTNLRIGHHVMPAADRPDADQWLCIQFNSFVEAEGTRKALKNWHEAARAKFKPDATQPTASNAGERDGNGNLPCPFCGGECDPAGWLGGDGERGPECDECGATAESVEVWNQRAALASKPPAGEQKPTAQQIADYLRGLDGMVSVKAEDANNYCRVLTALGMEEEGDPVAAIEDLKAAVHDAEEAALQPEQVAQDGGKKGGVA